MIRYHLHRALGVEHSSLLSSENPKFWYTVPIFCMGGNDIFLGFLTEVAKYFRRLTARCHKTGGKWSTCRLIATEWNTVSGSTADSRTILPSRTNSLELSFQIGKFLDAKINARDILWNREQSPSTAQIAHDISKCKFVVKNLLQFSYLLVIRDFLSQPLLYLRYDSRYLT